MTQELNMEITLKADLGSLCQIKIVEIDQDQKQISDISLVYILSEESHLLTQERIKPVRSHLQMLKILYFNNLFNAVRTQKLIRMTTIVNYNTLAVK